MFSLPVLFVLIFIVVIVLVLIKQSGKVRIDKTEPIESIEAFFDQQLPITSPPEDYVSSKFVYRYGDSFIYHGADAATLYQVYPLCCEKCTRNAYLQLMNRSAWNSEHDPTSEYDPNATLNNLTAEVIGMARYPSPPQNQGQATDTTAYVVLKLSRLAPYSGLRDITNVDLVRFMRSIARHASWKISDVSIANVGRSLGTGHLALQFMDNISQASSSAKNLFYNRYNVLKHIPESSFVKPGDYIKYAAMLKLVEASGNHLRDLESFVTTLG